MLYKNSLKILFSNFNIVWKSIIYFLLVFSGSAFLIYLCINPVYKLMVQNGIIEEFLEIYTDFLTSLNFLELCKSVGVLGDKLFGVIVENISKIWLNFTGVALTILFLSVYLNNLTIMPMCNSLHYYMGSMNKHGYYSSYFDVFKKNLLAQLVYFIVSLPVKALICFAIVMTLKLFDISWIWSILGFFILVILWICLEAFKYTLFAGWMPTMVIMNYGVFKALRVSVKNAFRQFPRMFGNAVGIVLTQLCVYVLGVFTFFVGLIVIIPAGYLLYSSYGMVATYENQGMRFYVDIYNVVTPKKKEISDKLSDMKYII